MRRTESWFQGFDQFGEHFKMKIDADNSILQSTMGSILSVAMIMMVGIFTYQKVEVWLTKKGVDITSATNDSFFSDDY